MIKVLFVGDKPSRLNASPDVPFVGARCFPTFVEWVKFLAPDYYYTVNSECPEDLKTAGKLHSAGFKVVALGKLASKRLSMSGVDHFMIPHPSGLNRQLNNVAYIGARLLLCRGWLRSDEEGEE